jgi:hypothetical protein
MSGADAWEDGAPMTVARRRRHRARRLAAAGAALLLLAACSSGHSNGPLAGGASTTTTTTAPPGGGGGSTAPSPRPNQPALPDHLRIEVLSSQPDRVTGGDARIRVVPPAGVAPSEVRVHVGAVDVTRRLHVVPGASATGRSRAR